MLILFFLKIQHSCMMQNTAKFHLTQPIPLEANGHIAEHIQVIAKDSGIAVVFSLGPIGVLPNRPSN